MLINDSTIWHWHNRLGADYAAKEDVNSKLILVLAVLCVAMLPFKASATPHRLPPVPLDATLTFGDAHEIGDILPADPEGMADRLNYVTFMIALAPGSSGADTISG